jgi:phage-related protein
VFIDNDEANKSLAKTEQHAQGVVSKLGSIGKAGKFGAILGASAAIGVAAVHGIEKAITFAGSSTIGANASMEQYQNTLTVVMKSSKKAAQALAWAKDYANRTPWETDQIVDATAKLSAYGMNAQKILPGISDMSSAMGKSLDQGVEAIADAQTGELERLKEFGITKNMIVDQAKKMRLGLVVNNKGQITDQKAFNKALFGLMNDRYKGSTDIQSRSFNGMLSNIRGFFANALQTLSKPLFTKLEDGLRYIMPLFDGMTALMNGDMNGFNDSLTKVFGSSGANMIIGFFNQFKQAASTVSGVLGTVKTAISGVFAIFTGNSSKGASILSSLGLSPDQVNQVISVVNNVKQTLGTVFNGIIGYYNVLGQAVRASIQFMLQAWNIIMPYIMPILNNVLSFVQSIVSQIQVFWSQNGEMIMSAVRNVMTVILAILKVTMPIISFIVQTVLGSIMGIIQGGLNVIMGVIKFFAALFTGNFGAMWSAVKQIFVGAVQLIWNLMNLSFLGEIKSIFLNLAKSGLGAMKQLFTWVIGVFRDMPGSASGLMGSMVSNVIGWFTSLFTRASSIFTMLRNFGASIWSALRQTIVNAASGIWHSVVGHFSSMVGGISDSFHSILSVASSVFGRIVGVITNPINSARSLVGKAVNGIKNIFSNMKIHIPMPHFDFSVVKKKIAGISIPFPTVDVNWFKNGGLFPANSPQLVGMGDANVPEAALPLNNNVMGRIAGMISDRMPQRQDNPAPVNINITGDMHFEYETDEQEFSERLADNIRKKDFKKGIRPA